MTLSSTNVRLLAAFALAAASFADLRAQCFRPLLPRTQPAAISPGTIEFFAGNHGRGRSLGGHVATAGQKNVPNDAVRSLILRGVAPGTVIRLYDDGRGRPSDDWVEIRVRRYHPQLVIGTFEQCRSDAFVEVIYHRVRGNGNLDGKVSRVHVARG